MHLFLSFVILSVLLLQSGATPSKPDKRREVVPIKDNVHCLLVADLYNFGKNESRYAQEKRFIKFVSSRFFEGTEVSTMGVATYGYVPQLPINLDLALNKMALSYDEFSKNLEANTQLRNSNEHSDTAQALDFINRFKNLKGRANCLVFVTAQENTNRLPRLYLLPEWKRVVVVGFNDTDVTEIVRTTPSVAVRVPYSFKSKNVREVVDTILTAF